MIRLRNAIFVEQCTCSTTYTTTTRCTIIVSWILDRWELGTVFHIHSFCFREVDFGFLLQNAFTHNLVSLQITNTQNKNKHHKGESLKQKLIKIFTKRRWEAKQ